MVLPNVNRVNWFSVYHNVRGRETNYFFGGSIACFAEKKSGNQTVEI